MPRSLFKKPIRLNLIHPPLHQPISPNNPQPIPTLRIPKLIPPLKPHLRNLRIGRSDALSAEVHASEVACCHGG